MLVLHLDVGIAHALYIYTNSRFVTGLYDNARLVLKCIVMIVPLS